ncbi:MAG: hypothetical protein AAGF26_08950 [Cyanobacteria bacterium P01_G01_bin.49]
MAGLFGLFSGRKAKYVDEADTASSQPEKKEAFFLETDDAKSLGDAEFMRKSHTIKRTFPKRPGGKGGAIIQDISSMEKKKSGDNRVVSPKTNSATSPVQPTQPMSQKRRQGDDGMDMFRQMARNIKK